MLTRRQSHETGWVISFACDADLEARNVGCQNPSREALKNPSGSRGSITLLCLYRPSQQHKKSLCPDTLDVMKRSYMSHFQTQRMKVWEWIYVSNQLKQVSMCYLSQNVIVIFKRMQSQNMSSMQETYFLVLFFIFLSVYQQGLPFQSGSAKWEFTFSQTFELHRLQQKIELRTVEAQIEMKPEHQVQPGVESTALR